MGGLGQSDRRQMAHAWVNVTYMDQADFDAEVAARRSAASSSQQQQQ
jgi:hypothetical protein